MCFSKPEYRKISRDRERRGKSSTGLWVQRIINKAGKLTENTIKYLFKNAISNRKLIVLAASLCVWPAPTREAFWVLDPLRFFQGSVFRIFEKGIYQCLSSCTPWVDNHGQPMLQSVYWVQVISWMLILCRIQYKSLLPEAFSHDGFNTFNTSRWFEQSKECLLDVTWTDMPGYSTTWHDETSHRLSKSSTNLQMGLRCWWRPSIFQESEHLTLFICPHLASSHASSEWTIANQFLFFTCIARCLRMRQMLTLGGRAPAPMWSAQRGRTRTAGAITRLRLTVAEQCGTHPLAQAHWLELRLGDGWVVKPCVVNGGWLIIGLTTLWIHFLTE